VTYTTAALVAGFLMIPVAELRNQTYFGLLSAFTLFVAWVVDMTLTPALCSGLRIVTLWERLTLDLGPDPQHSIPLLADLRRSQARIVALMTDLRSFEPGQVLFRDGEAGEDMYVVVEGELVVWIEDEHEGRRELGRMHRGDVVGEVAPFSGRRTANVATVGRARLLRITMEDLEALRRRYPKIGATVYRMLARVPGAVSRGRARLAGHRLVFNKRGRDGSAKANLAAEADAEVWGVVWEIDVTDLSVLDPHEGGYERARVRVEASDGTRVEVEVYVSERLTEDLVPYDWYLEHVLRGARAHDLPEDYVARIEAVISRPHDRDGEST
jgi:hypothetical protein